jgi:hypothetical protein
MGSWLANMVDRTLVNRGCGIATGVFARLTLRPALFLPQRQGASDVSLVFSCDAPAPLGLQEPLLTFGLHHRSCR